MRTILRNATVIDGTGASPAQADVLIEDGTILDVSPGLDGDEAVDLMGQWLLPGIIDCHVHVMLSSINRLVWLDTPYSLRFYEAARNLADTLRAGVTFVRDAGFADRGVKLAVEQGLVTGPRMKIAVGIVTQTGGHADFTFACGSHLRFEHPGCPDGVADGVEGVLRKTREMIHWGADVIKICSTGGVLSQYDKPTASQFLPEEIAVVVAEAQAKGLTVMAHAQGTNGVKNAIRAGVSSIEHGIYLDDEAIDMMLERGTFLVPTLIAPLGVLAAPEGLSAQTLAKAREVVDVHRESIRRAAAAGVRIAMGTDSGVTPHGRNLDELVQMAEIGMAPMAVIEASTRVAAQNLGVADRVGTIETGKEADFVALHADPLADVAAVPRSVSRVWQRGRQVVEHVYPAPVVG